MALGRYVFEGGTAVVTGAASGIGAALAHELAERGSNLVLVDRDGPRLAGVVSSIRAEHPGLEVSSHVVDLSDLDAVRRLGTSLTALPRVTLLINNAGVALGGRFDQVTMDEFDWVMRVNFQAPLLLTHLLLPTLKASPGSHLVNVSSLFGLVAPAGQSAYAASKFALRGFGESLRQELAGEVGVTLVHPGGVRTRIAESARVGSGVPAEEYAAELKVWDRLLTIPPDRAAGLVVDAVEHRRPRLLIGWTAKAPDVLARLAPVGATRVHAAADRALRRLAARRTG